MPYFGQARRITWPEVSVSPGDGDGEIPLPEQVLILHYLLNASQRTPHRPDRRFPPGPGRQFYWSAFVSRVKTPFVSTFGQDLPLYTRWRRR